MLILLPASLDARTDAAAEKPAVDPANAYGGNVLSLTYKLHIVLGLPIQSEANGEECSQGAGTWHGGHHQSRALKFTRRLFLPLIKALCG